MNELSECESDSTEDSSSMLWETIKVDLSLNRACQKEQLRSLKGSSDKLSPNKQRVRKHLKRSSKAMNRFHSKKAALKTAIGMIRAVTRRVKFSRRRHTVSFGSTPVMNFKVVDNSPKVAVDNVPHPLPTSEKKPEAEDGRDNACQNRPLLKDESTQTIPCSLEDKSLQTCLQDSYNLNIRNPISAHQTIPLKACGMTCFPTFASCCPQPMIRACHCSVPCPKSLPTEESHAGNNKQVPSSNGNVGTQYTLKQICEELLVQLSARRVLISNKQTASDSNNRECGTQTSTGPSDATVGDLKSIVHSLQSIQNDLKKNMVVHQHIVPTSITISRAETKSQSVSPIQFEPIPSKPTAEERRIPEPVPVVSDPASSSVTPDLLQLTGEFARFGTTTPAEVSTVGKDKCENTSQFKAPFPLEISEQQKDLTNSKKVDSIETINWPTMITLEENSDKLLQQMLDAGLVTILNSAANLNQNENNGDTDFATQMLSNPNVTNKRLNLQAAEAANSNESSVANSSDDFVLVLEAEENNQNAMCEEKPSGTVSTDDLVSTDNYNNTHSNQSSSINVDVVGSDEELLNSKLLDPKINADMYNNLETESLSKIIGTDSPSTQLEIENSDPFEDVDSSEMDNILMVWRQQEKLHQNKLELDLSSHEPYLFKMTNRALEPKSFRIHRPPPLTNNHQNGASTSQSLDKKGSEPAVEEEDDVPENSPSVLPTPKKRRLSLKKNPPSPLPVVFHSKQKVAEAFKIEGANLPDDNGNSPLNSEQSRESKESTVSEGDDDDTPLSLRACKRKKATTKRTQGKSLSHSVSSKNRDMEEQTCVQGSPKSSRKGKSKNNEKSTETSKKDKSKLVDKPNEGINAEEKNTLSYSQIVAWAQNIHYKKEDFKNQIKERSQTMNKRWLQEKSVDGIKELCQPTSVMAMELSQGQIFQEKMQKIREISCYDLGKAHDTAVNILLNPWRGINARKVTRDFEPPKHDGKCVSRSLWDLRSGANPDDIVNRIMAMGWGELDMCALKTMVSMFVLCLSRSVPFIIEAARNGEEDDTCSILSDLDLISKKKATSVRVIATRHIFKGECIEGMNGLILKPSQQDKGKDRLKTWVFPKFGESRNHVMLGPLAYLKRRDDNCNTEAVILKADIVIVKATRQILCGERLLVSLKRLEKCLCQRN